MDRDNVGGSWWWKDGRRAVGVEVVGGVCHRAGSRLLILIYPPLKYFQSHILLVIVRQFHVVRFLHSSKTTTPPLPMEELKHQKNEYCGFDNIETPSPSPTPTPTPTPSLCNALKHWLLNLAIDGVDKVFVDRKRMNMNSLSNEVPQKWCSTSKLRDFQDSEECGSINTKGRNYTFQENDRGSARKGRKVNNYFKNEDHDGSVQSKEINFLAFFTTMLIKLMGFQFNIVATSLTFPIRLSYFSFMFFFFPFRTLRHVRAYLTKKLLRILGISRRRVTEKAKKSVLNIAFRVGFGLFWSSYVFLMLLGLMTLGFVFGGLIMRIIVEKPIQLTQTLNFDYTKTSPVAYVPIMPYSGAVEASALAPKEAGVRIIPHNHKLHLTVSLIVPESDYNRNLGIFQVRVEFTSATGKIITSSSQACILRFKSQPVRVIQTIIQTAPIMAGLQTETQILDIEMKDIIEGLEPTAYLKVVVESRAEYKSGAGIPEIHKASLALESDLPHMRRLIWKWRRSIFVWMSILMFLTQLMLLLVCCRSVVVPRGMHMLAYARKLTSKHHLLE
ncbi:seipin-2-like [Mercurialis annua]|uniref:seipin-2-like n=1 Tax=Mercurialis annua TaxID=3986 RepID=UPI00215E9EE9|nr:seipin-2-like [Mercurialis annua]